MKQTVLIVEDSGSTRLHLEKILSDLYTIVFASHGEEMWKMLPEIRPSLILMDIMIPGDTGFDLASRLSKHEEFRNIPVIYLTGRDTSEDIVKGFETGCLDYIRKPFNDEELKARIKSVLRIKDLENRLRTYSVTDFLTGIYNRRYFLEAAKSSLHYSQRSGGNVCLALLDIDHFKTINDSMGHDAGDFLLKKFTELIKSKIRPYDVFARHGGEEFVVLFPDCPKDKCTEIVQRIRDNLKKRNFNYNGNKIHFTFSAGIVSAQDEPTGTTIKELIHRADVRLYRAKEAGRDCVVNS